MHPDPTFLRLKNEVWLQILAKCVGKLMGSLS